MALHGHGKTDLNMPSILLHNPCYMAAKRKRPMVSAIGLKFKALTLF
jgi:hypothetical protein